MGMIPGMPFKVKGAWSDPVHIPAQPPQHIGWVIGKLLQVKPHVSVRRVKQRPWIVVQVYGTVTKEL